MTNQEIYKLRKELHQYPELSGKEYNTANRIKNFINNHYPTEIIENVGGAGLMAVYKFSELGTTITIRCELDALPIEEVNNFEYKSTNRGISHKCGHDGHMAIVAGLIFWLKNQTFKTGKIVLLFQPAEETGKGANQVVNDQRFIDLKSDYIFALHNIPGEPLNTIITTKKTFSSEVISFAVYLNGKKAHASEPENGINPAYVISNVIKELSHLNITDPKNENFAILTPIHIHMGDKTYGVSASSGEIHFTIRTWSGATMELLKKKIETIIAKEVKSHKMTCEIDWFEYFPSCNNDPNCNKLITEAAVENGLIITERNYPFKFGEDFGWFSKKYKSAMFGLGAGINSPALHHADYDFPEEIIESGINMFTSLIDKIICE